MIQALLREREREREMTVSSVKHRGKSYSVLLILAFTAAMMAVMMLNKVKEIRVHNMFIEEKDREIMSLNTKFQRAKAHAEEMRGKLENMKADMESLKNKNAVLKNKVMQVQSLTASLKEKYSNLIADLEEKRVQIVNLQEKQKRSKIIYSQLVTLRETLKQKEDEIHRHKKRQDKPLTNHILVSNNNSYNSSSPVNVTRKISTADMDKNKEARGAVDRQVDADDVGKKEESQQYLATGNIDKEREEDGVLDGKQQEKLDALKELPGDRIQPNDNRTDTLEDERVSIPTSGKPAKEEKGHLQQIENSYNGNVDTNQNETVILVTNFDDIQDNVIKTQEESSKEANVRQHRQTFAEDGKNSKKLELRENVTRSTVKH